LGLFSAEVATVGTSPLGSSRALKETAPSRVMGFGVANYPAPGSHYRRPSRPVSAPPRGRERSKSIPQNAMRTRPQVATLSNRTIVSGIPNRLRYPTEHMKARRNFVTNFHRDETISPNPRNHFETKGRASSLSLTKRGQLTCSIFLIWNQSRSRYLEEMGQRGDEL
jgi:hypothetical protein